MAIAMGRDQVVSTMVGQSREALDQGDDNHDVYSETETHMAGEKNSGTPHPLAHFLTPSTRRAVSGRKMLASQGPQY